MLFTFNILLSWTCTSCKIYFFIKNQKLLMFSINAIRWINLIKETAGLNKYKYPIPITRV